MATITANTGANAWNTNGCWVGGVQPSAADDVVIPASAVVTLPAATTCLARSLTIQASGTLVWGSSSAILNVGDGTAGAGNVAVSISGTATITLTGVGTLNLISSSATQQTITSGGKTLPIFTINGAGSSYLLSDGLTTTGNVGVSAGTFDSGSQAISCQAFAYGNATARTITLGSSAITVSTATGFTGTAVTNLTMTANTAVITLAQASAVINLLNMNWNGLSFVLTGSVVATVNTTGATIGSLTRTGTSSILKADSLIISGGNITCTGTIRLDGNSITNRLLVQGELLGTPRTITAATMSASTNFVDFMDITGAGAANWNLSSGSVGDALGNSGITFTTPVTRFAIFAVAGNWSDTARWSGTSGGATGASVPLCHDDVIFDNNSMSASGKNVTPDMSRLCKNLSTSAQTNFAFQITRPTAGFSCFVYGNCDMTAVSTLTTSNWTCPALMGRGTHTYTPCSGTNTSGVSVQALGGSYTLTKALSVVNQSPIVLLAGTFDTASFAVTSETFNSATTTYTRTLTLGTTTYTLAGVAASATWSVAASNLTISAASSTIIYSAATANARTFAGAGFTYGTFTYTVAGSTGQLTITGANTFSTFNFSDVTNARTLLFTAATTTTIGTAFNVNGTATKLMTIGSVTAANHTIAMPSGVSDDYLSISRSTLTGNSAYAGVNSTDGGNNSTAPGWIFTAPPATNTGGFFSLMQP